MSSITIRPTTSNDLAQIVAMIQELADFEKMSEGPQLKVEDLFRDGNFDGKSAAPLYYSFVAEEVDTQKLVGYSIGFFTYSTWEGKAYLLEDIYVKPDFRSQGIGKKMFVENVKFASSQKCVRFDFHVLNWNPAKNFYERLGAVNLSEKEGWEFYRLNQEQMKALNN